MLLEIFLSFLALSITGVWLGYKTGDNFHAFVGLTILFFLSLVLFTGSLQVRSGETALTNYTYAGGNLTADTSTLTYTYSAVNDTYSDVLGKALAFASGFGAVLLLVNMRNARKKEAEE